MFDQDVCHRKETRGFKTNNSYPQPQTSINGVEVVDFADPARVGN